MARKRLSTEDPVSKLLEDTFSDEDDDGDSAPDSFSSGVEEDFEEGDDLFEDISDEDYIPSTSPGQSRSTPLSSSSQQQASKSVSEPEQTNEGDRCHATPSKSPSTRKQGHGTWTATSPQTPRLSAAGWQTEQQPDVLPEPLPGFCPARTPGVQVFWLSDEPSPSELFKTFFDEKSVRIICDNTNKQAQKKINEGKKFKWRDIIPIDFFKFVGLLFYMAVLKLPEVRLYWKQNSLFSVLSPALVMSRNTFQVISWNLHLSDPDEDAENDKKKGTPEYDPLHRLRPLYDHLRNACKASYHPRQNVSIDERMVTTKAKTGMRQCIKNKPNKYGLKLFVMADFSNGYTSDFSVYTGKYHNSSGHGLTYDTVIGLMSQKYLGSGYHLYCDNYYTSPKLFMELCSLKVRACGTYRDNRRESRTKKKDSRGTIRWMRNGPLLFVKWMDSKQVSMCSTIHTVYSGEIAKRHVKGEDGQWRIQNIPMPTPVAEYNKYMGGVDLSDQLIQYYSVHHKTVSWYRLLFQHFIDIAATNSYILHKELSRMNQKQPMTHLKFMETLTAELCGYMLDMTPVPPSRKATPGTPSECVLLSTLDWPSTPDKVVIQTCTPVAIKPDVDKSKKATDGRLSCVHCKKKTAWKCRNCGVSLCVIVDRNCFADWHDAGPFA
ncbi:piggyBac transposable element-derived protein 4-like [Seriola lalandi dorsalis]|uniref:piggyBac transposable element-derived protein 4-like n=1 Tax=Seriola lalandi dorsalis TaxID=1841481 RepID=UPI000C6FA76C|nr:piggyBac transposable element-derived protein 4-like [Seriola lalandi dorsalis]